MDQLLTVNKIELTRLGIMQQLKEKRVMLLDLNFETTQQAFHCDSAEQPRCSHLIWLKEKAGVQTPLEQRAFYI